MGDVGPIQRRQSGFLLVVATPGVSVMPKYEIKDSLRARLDNTFKYHKPKSDQAERYVALRDKAHELALIIAANTPESREQSLALTKLEESIMHANAAIARHE